MSKEKNVPDIRFKEFSGEWANKEIGNILAEIKRPIELIDDESYQLVTVKRRNEGVVPRSTLKGRNILVKNYFTVKAGDYLISKRQVVHGANGVVPESLDNAVVSNEYLVVTDSDEITAKFWTVVSKRPEMHKLFFISSYGVDIEKLVFDVADWKNRAITIPEIIEQNSITDYFQKLDSLINQHQQKHGKLRNIKKAMLEKMFPKQGETLPEIRFKGFSGEWDEKQFSNVFEERDGIRRGPFGGSIKKEMFVPASDYVVYEQRNAIYDRYDTRYNISKEKYLELSNFKLTAGDFIMSGAGTIGRVSRVPNGISQGVFNQAIIRMKLDEENIDSEFFLQWIRSEKMQERLTESNPASAMVNLVPMSELRGWDVLMPKKYEQIAIGNYFQKLDTLINQHQQQITKLNNIKQACLNKMFV